MKSRQNLGKLTLRKTQPVQTTDHMETELKSQKSSWF